MPRIGSWTLARPPLNPREPYESRLPNTFLRSPYWGIVDHTQLLRGGYSRVFQSQPIENRTQLKPNYSFEKRQRELEKKKKKAEKNQKKVAASSTPSEGATHPEAPPSA